MCWYFKSYLTNPAINCYLLYRDKEPIGYGVIRYIEEKPWVTGGVREKFRGQGYGELIFRKLTCHCLEDHNEVFLSVLKSNQRAINLYFKLGYKITGQDQKQFFMRRSFEQI